MTAALDLAARATGIGASEIAAVCGISPYATPLDIYCRKLGLTEGSKGNDLTEWGLRLEPAIAAAYVEKTGILVEGDGRETFAHPEYEFAIATPDRVACDRSRIVELKTANHFAASSWGESGTDRIPEYYVCQVAWQMGVLDIDRADVAALIGGHDFRVYSLERDRELERDLFDIGLGFWRDHVKALVPPDPTDSDSLARYLLARFPRDTRPLEWATERGEALGGELRRLRAGIAELEAKEQEIETELKAMIADAAGIEGSFGRITWKAARETVTTDWKSIALALAPSSALIARHTTRRPGARRFLAKWNEGES